MKKIVVLVLAIIMMASMCACSNNTESTTEPSLPQEVIDTNPMFVSMGKTMEINGKTYTAATLWETIYGDARCSKDGEFYVNRINGDVFLVILSDTSRGYEVATWVDIHLTYEGVVTIAGVEIAIPDTKN